MSGHDDEGCFWEDSAEEAVVATLDQIEWSEGSAVFPTYMEHEASRVAHSMSDLLQKLQEVYEEDYYGNVPFDGGEAVFSADPVAAETIAGEHLRGMEEQLKTAGWLACFRARFGKKEG